MKCATSLGGISRLEQTDWLESLSMERLQAKASRVADILKFTGNDWEQTCFVILARALGFGLNGDPLEMLARSFLLSNTCIIILTIRYSYRLCSSGRLPCSTARFIYLMNITSSFVANIIFLRANMGYVRCVPAYGNIHVHVRRIFHTVVWHFSPRRVRGILHVLQDNRRQGGCRDCGYVV